MMIWWLPELVMPCVSSGAFTNESTKRVNCNCMVHLYNSHDFSGEVLVLSSSCFADFSSFTTIAPISWLLLSFIVTFIKTILWGLSLFLFVYTSRFADIYGIASKEFSWQDGQDFGRLTTSIFTSSLFTSSVEFLMNTRNIRFPF